MAFARKDAAPSESNQSMAGESQSPTADGREAMHFGLFRHPLKAVIIVGAAVLLIFSAVAGSFMARSLRNGFAEILQSHDTSAALQRFRRTTAALASDHRSYLLTGQTRFLTRYRDAAASLPAQYATLRALTAGVPRQEQAMEVLAQQLARDAAAVAAAADQPEPMPPSGLVPALLRTEHLFRATDDIMDDMLQYTRDIRSARIETAASRTDWTVEIAMFRSMVSVILITLLLLVLQRNTQIQDRLGQERAAAIAEARTASERQAQERRQTQAALRQREMLLRGLTDAIPQIVFVTYRDGSGEFINRRWHEYTGAAASFTQAQEWHRLVHPDDVERLHSRWHQALQLSAPLVAECRLRGREGEYLWFLVLAVPVATDSHWVGTFTDIEHLHRADAARRESEERFRRIFEGSPFGMTLSEASADRRILQANPAFCQMLGYAPDELIGRSLNDLTHPEERDPHRGAALIAELDRGWTTVNKRYLNKQGGVVWARVRVAAFEPMSGADPQLLAVVEDVTRQREAEEALRQAQRMEAVGQLSGGLAHDFNNLLGVILGNIECLLDTMADDPERAALAQDVLESALSGAELTRRLLAFGRRQSLAPRLIDLSAEAAAHVGMLGRALGAAIRIETIFAHDLRPARADPSQLGDALLNLAINARDAMPDGGVLTIETYNEHIDADEAASGTDIAQGDYVVLAVSDTGVGMPPEVLARAVEPFFTTKPPGAGSGLGLSMIYGFVRQSGGYLTIASEIGTGTTARICLPRAEGHVVARLRKTVAHGLPTGSETILVVDDSSEMRQVAARHLRSVGYHVLCAENGPAALAQLQAGGSVDLLFTDIAMPEGMSGFQLAATARQIRPGLRVLYTTGYAGISQPDMTPRWQECLIRKPYRRQELAEKIRAALDGEPVA
jgi:PAS domain S-box-containing protein